MCKDMPPLELAIQFHGHICPGLLMGVRAAEFARQYLEVSQDYDEELLAMVETNSCAVDAIQSILGCTFGKGNLIFRDYGKHVFVIASREKQRAVRVAQKYGALDGEEFKRYRELVRQEQLSDDELSEKEYLIGVFFEKIMTIPFEDLFNWREVSLDMPEKARIYKTVQCSVCGEGVMEPRAIVTEQGFLCPECNSN